jgi:predicted nucleic acid-binding protein
MASWVVADSNVLLSNVLVETYSAKAEKLLRSWQAQSIRLAAPSLIWYEIVAVVRNHVFRGVLTQDSAIKVRDLLLSKSIRLMLDDALLRRGYELATQFNHPTAYDAQYLAVAERLQCEFWTADEKLFNSIKQNLSWAKWLGNFTG